MRKNSISYCLRKDCNSCSSCKLYLYYLPPKVEFPVEATPRHVRRLDVLESGVGYDVNDGADHRRPVFYYPRQQRFQPTLYKSI